jgi:type IV pilus assembly protein PilM
MASRTKHLVGLDFDPSGIAVAQVAAGGRLVIDRAAVADLEPGVVRDGEVTDVEGLSAALRGLWSSHKGLGKRVRVGVANQKIVVRVLDLPPVSDPKELEAAVLFQAQEQVPMPLDKAVLDFQPLGIVETDAGPRQRVVIVAARRDMVDRILAAVRGAGLRPEGIDLSAFAMVRALHEPAPDDEQVLYLFVGGLANLAVAQGTTCLFTRTSGEGLEALAIELAERQRLTLEHARAWLEHVGLDEPLEEIDGDSAIVAEARSVLADGSRRIAAQVRNSLDFHRAQDTAASVSRVVLTGPAVAVPGLAGALGAELGLPVTTGTVLGGPDGVNSGRIAVAAGLALTEAPA